MNPVRIVLVDNWGRLMMVLDIPASNPGAEKPFDQAPEKIVVDYQASPFDGPRRFDAFKAGMAQDGAGDFVPAFVFEGPCPPPYTVGFEGYDERGRPRWKPFTPAALAAYDQREGA